MADKNLLVSVVTLDYTNAKVLINTGTFFLYNIRSKQQDIVFTAVKSVLFLPPYFISQFTIAEEIIPSIPIVSNFPYVVFAL